LVDVIVPRPGMRHDNFQVTDPLPGIGDVLDFGLRQLPAALKRQQSRS
jgi:hypothetical protein